MAIIRVLLIEDDEDDYLITRDLLRDITSKQYDLTQYELTWVSDWQQAQLALASSDFDVCLMDYSLGRGDGLALLSLARKQGSNVPVIMLTGQEDNQLDAEASQAGAVDYLIKKNLTVTVLERSIRYAVARKQIETERVERLKAESESQAKTRFLTHLSHELRTPLTAILGFTDLLNRRFLPDIAASTRAKTATDNNALDEAINAADIIRRNGKHLLSLLNDVLDLSKIEAGKLDINIQPTPLSPLLSDVFQLLQIKADSKGLAFQLEADGPIPAKLLTDAIRLQQILLNLVTNAVKFTQGGSVKLSVGWLQQEERIHFTVTDTGIGIAEHNLSRLFSPFSQLHTSSPNAEPGTGLGLAISLQLAKRLGGTLTATSEEGVGSSFQLTLPCHISDSMELDFSEMGILENTATPPRLSGRVLVADDVEEIRALVSQYLLMAGLQVDTVKDGALALESVRQFPDAYDVLILDINMPKLSGVEVTQRLRSEDIFIPTVALTAAGKNSEQEYFARGGFDVRLCKPVDRDHLWRVLAELLPSKQAPCHSSNNEDSQFAQHVHSKKHRVLVVEDNKDARDGLMQLLRLLGLEVVGVDSGASALAALDQQEDEQPINTVLIDMNLQGARANQCLPALRNKLSTTANIVLVSGESFSQQQARELGFDDVCAKPIDLEKIKALFQVNLHS